MNNLDQVVLDLLQARKGDWQKVAEASGVSYSWLSKFANGHIENPGFGTLVKLHEYLAAPSKELINTKGAPAVPADKAEA